MNNKRQTGTGVGYLGYRMMTLLSPPGWRDRCGVGERGGGGLVSPPWDILISPDWHLSMRLHLPVNDGSN